MERESALMDEGNRATRTFQLDDQKFFAEFSGDRNPMHLDPIFARRTLYGQCLVHGAHIALCGLERFHSHLESLSQFKITFRSPLFLDQSVAFRQTENSISVHSRTLHCDIALDFQNEVPYTNQNSEDPHETPHECLNPSVASLSSLKGELPLPLPPRAKDAFPKLAEQRPDLIRLIAASSRLVGMICPGLHSLFSSLEWTHHGPLENQLQWSVIDFDDRSQKLEIEIKSGASRGLIVAFRRPEAVEQNSLENVQNRFQGDFFANQRALVIGGSRGLGEIGTKLLLAGGAKVWSTYYRGADDMAEISKQAIMAQDRFQSSFFDCLNPDQHTVSAMQDWKPTHLYYFASPKILATTADNFLEQWQLLHSFFVEGLIQSTELFLNRGLVGLFYPSTAFIDESENMEAYTAAKVVGETYLQYLRSQHQLKTEVPRLPPLRTDQTQAVLAEALPEPDDLLHQHFLKLAQQP